MRTRKPVRTPGTKAEDCFSAALRCVLALRGHGRFLACSADARELHPEATPARPGAVWQLFVAHWHLSLPPLRRRVGILALSWVALPGRRTGKAVPRAVALPKMGSEGRNVRDKPIERWLTRSPGGIEIHSLRLLPHSSCTLSPCLSPLGRAPPCRSLAAGGARDGWLGNALSGRAVDEGRMTRGLSGSVARECTARSHRLLPVLVVATVDVLLRPSQPPVK